MGHAAPQAGRPLASRKVCFDGKFALMNSPVESKGVNQNWGDMK